MDWDDQAETRSTTEPSDWPSGGAPAAAQEPQLLSTGDHLHGAGELHQDDDTDDEEQAVQEETTELESSAPYYHNPDYKYSGGHTYVEGSRYNFADVSESNIVMGSRRTREEEHPAEQATDPDGLDCGDGDADQQHVALAALRDGQPEPRRDTGSTLGEHAEESAERPVAMRTARDMRGRDISTVDLEEELRLPDLSAERKVFDESPTTDPLPTPQSERDLDTMPPPFTDCCGRPC